MALTLSYDSSLSRVHVSADSLGSGAAYAVVEKSLNEALWTTVRGATALPVESQEAEVYDHEFYADVTNYYRITSYDDNDVQQEQYTDDITPDLEGRVWIKSIKYPALNMPARTLDTQEERQLDGRGEAVDIVGRNAAIGVHERMSGPRFPVVLRMDDDEAAGRLMTALSVGGTVFIHAPTGSRVPGGYVMVNSAGSQYMARAGAHPAVRVTLDCTTVAPPHPRITGTLPTAETIFRLYGNAEALYAAHSHGRSLLNTVASLDDLVVY